MSPNISGQFSRRGITAFIKTLFIAALFSSLASYSHACGVDSVAAQTDTTITINWSVSDCNKLSASETFEVCWKTTGTWNFPCGANRQAGYNESGTSIISGLSPSTAYKIRTKWHHRSTGWHLITNRTVTTNPTATSSDTALRYVKASSQGYCVDFYWKNPPAVTPGNTLILHIMKKTTFAYFNWNDPDLTGATFNSSTGEYTTKVCNFSNNYRYKATVALRKPAGDIHTSGNDVVWQ